MTEPGELLKSKSDCGCGCGRFGVLNAHGCVRGCTACPTCRGKRNRAKGHAAQNKARKKLGVKATPGSSNEEGWVDELFASEVKSGKQVGPVFNLWRRCEGQIIAARPDHGVKQKASRVIAMPEGWNDGLVIVRLSDWEHTIRPALDDYWGTP